METNRQEILENILISVVEEFAFMFAEPLSPEEPAPAPVACLVVSVSFSGEHKGAVTIATDTAFPEILRENVLGVGNDSEASADIAQDALRELANVLTGQLVTALYGKARQYDLSVPDLREGDSSTWQQLTESPGTEEFRIDQESLLLLRFCEDELPAMQQEVKADMRVEGRAQ